MKFIKEIDIKCKVLWLPLYIEKWTIKESISSVEKIIMIAGPIGPGVNRTNPNEPSDKSLEIIYSWQARFEF